MDTEKVLREKFELLRDTLSERARRAWAATEALAVGAGGIAMVHRATGLAVSTIRRGIRDLTSEQADPGRVRRPGGGRKRVTESDPTLLKALNRLVEPWSRGDPESSLRWTTKSLRKLTEELNKQGYKIGFVTCGRLLKESGYSLQANRKVREGGNHPDRDAQFKQINRKVEAQLRSGQPCISVDCKKKELVGDFKNPGREWHAEGQSPEVRVYDFVDPELGKAIPYGIYDIDKNMGWVGVGVDHDTAEFAVATIERWWDQFGASIYTGAKSLLITADGGGSNGSRVRLWKWELQKLADKTGLTISVCHLPPGTSKWNKIEHKLFSFISQNWRGKPLLSRATVVNLIANTTTSTGLKVHAYLDSNKYPLQLKVTDEQMDSIIIKRSKFHGEWNYTICPRS